MNNEYGIPDPSKTRKQDILIVAGVFAFLCICAAGLAGGAAYLQSGQHARATAAGQTGEAGVVYAAQTQQVQQTLDRQTQEAREMISRQTQAAHDLDVTATHVSAATERAGFVYADQFDRNANGWREGDFDNEAWSGSIHVEDGHLAWSIEQAKRGFSFWTEPSSLPTAEDFDVYVDVRLRQTDGSDLSCGIEFRRTYQTDGYAYYAFFVADAGRFTVQRMDPTANDWIVLVDWTDTNDFISGQWNTLGVSARGDHFVLTINDRIVGSFTDSNLNRGKLALTASATDGDSGLVWFDNYDLQLR